VFGFDPVVEIVGLALVFSLVSAYLNNLFGIRKRMREIQEEFKAYQKELSEATKSRDEAKIKKLSDKSARLNSLMMEMTILPWKSLVFALPLFFLFTGDPWLTHYGGLIPLSYRGFSILLPFDLHPAAVYSLQFLHSSVYGPKGFFIVAVLGCGMVVASVEQNWEKLSGRFKRSAK
jgi:uncharacterized membrane protein (DUF106 family)